MPTHGTAKQAQPIAGERHAVAALSHGHNPRGTELKRITSNQSATSHGLPSNLADVALLDIRDVCAVTRMSASWIHDEVRSRRFPQPMRFGPRCTRWRSADIREWLIARAAGAEADEQTGAQLSARAKKASDAAKAKRLAAVQPGGASQ